MGDYQPRQHKKQLAFAKRIPVTKHTPIGWRQFHQEKKLRKAAEAQKRERAKMEKEEKQKMKEEAKSNEKHGIKTKPMALHLAHSKSFARNHRRRKAKKKHELDALAASTASAVEVTKSQIKVEQEKEKLVAKVQEEENVYEVVFKGRGKV